MRILIVDYETEKVKLSIDDEDFIIEEAALEGIMVGQFCGI